MKVGEAHQKSFFFFFNFNFLFFKRLNLFFLCIAGEWHQYDDIICAEPSNNMFEWFKKAVWPDQKKSVLQGRKIAGTFMLESIFDLLTSWSKINLRNFFSQLRQFFEIYGNPYVYEKKQMQWSQLDYSEKDVSKPYASWHILNTFILYKISSPKQENSVIIASLSYIKKTLQNIQSTV